MFEPRFTITLAVATALMEIEANRRLLASLHRTPLGKRLEQVLWSASGSEGIQKALWSCLAFQKDRDVILATRHGFHGKKGLAEAVTGDENMLEHGQSPVCDRTPRSAPHGLPP